MTMNSKTHTGYQELQIEQVFDWTLADRNGRVDDPKQAPKGADIDPLFEWKARVIATRPEQTLHEFVEAGGDAENYDGAPEVLEYESGIEPTYDAARQAAKDFITTVQDEYLKPAEGVH